MIRLLFVLILILLSPLTAQAQNIKDMERRLIVVEAALAEQVKDGKVSKAEMAEFSAEIKEIRALLRNPTPPPTPPTPPTPPHPTACQCYRPCHCGPYRCEPRRPPEVWCRPTYRTESWCRRTTYRSINGGPFYITYDGPCTSPEISLDFYPYPAIPR